MNHFLKTSVVLVAELILSLSAIAADKIPEKNGQITARPNIEITVGQRLTDSTASISISNSTVQQSVIGNIQLLANTTVTSAPVTIIISKSASFLLFSVTDTAGLKKSIALQLYESGSGALSFKSGAGKSIHISTATPNCNTCSYILDHGILRLTACGENSCVRFVDYKM